MLRRRVAAVLASDYRQQAGAIGLVAWTAPVATCLAAIAILQIPQMFVVAPRLEGPLLVDARPVPMAERSTAFAPAPPADRSRRVAEQRVTAIGGRAAAAESLPAEPAGSGAAAGLPFAAMSPAEPVPSREYSPLPSVPVPLAGAAGIGAAAGQSGTFPAAQVSGGAWWSGPLELGDKTGTAAASAGRATASFFKRVGSSAPRVFAH
jgi:hypothetical protein